MVSHADLQISLMPRFTLEFVEHEDEVFYLAIAGILQYLAMQLYPDSQYCSPRDGERARKMM
jgi:hypothetical protein